jgi:murein DD-endopeptidase MepM/ murein hydrolase activator NlpD
MVKKRRKILNWFQKKFQLILYHGANYDLLWKIRFNRAKLTSLILFILILLFSLFYVLIAYTPLKNYIPGYPTEETKILTYENVIRTDSLIKEIEQRDIYLGMLRELIFNEIPIDENFVVPTDNLTDEQIREFNNPTKTRKQVSSEKRKNRNLTNFNDTTSDNTEIDNTTSREVVTTTPNINRNLASRQEEQFPTLFPPLRGEIVAPYDKFKSHYGIDIASRGETAILSTLNGVVLSADYTIESGYTIIIQHKYDLVSVYKHNKSVLVKAGQYVEIGQAIAIYGGTGEFSSGQHLHFELWRKGVSLNPEDYINFE